MEERRPRGFTKPRLGKPGLLRPTTYPEARSFIKHEYEKGPIKDEAVNYRMTSIDLAGSVPKVHGAFSLYYDNILTQYAMEWELTRALTQLEVRPADLFQKGTLPLREAVELQVIH